MSIYCIECSEFSKNNSIEVKNELVAKINLCSTCVKCGFKKYEFWSNLLNVYTIYNTMSLHYLKCKWSLFLFAASGLQRQINKN